MKYIEIANLPLFFVTERTFLIGNWSRFSSPDPWLHRRSLGFQSLSLAVMAGRFMESQGRADSPTYHHQAAWWFQTWLLFSISSMGYFFPLTNSYFSRWLKPPSSKALPWLLAFTCHELPWNWIIWYHISGQTHVTILYQMIIHLLFVQIWVLLHVDASCRWIHIIHGGFGSLDQHARQKHQLPNFNSYVKLPEGRRTVFVSSCKSC